MELKNLMIHTPNGSKFKVHAEVELHATKGYQVTRITKINGEPVKDNYVLKSHVSHEDILKHLGKTK